jgi:OmcA/MtrC family decaheme c-type cytochrome
MARLAKDLTSGMFIVAFVLGAVLAMPSAALAGQGDCGQPATDGDLPSAADCLYILKAAVGTRTCNPSCICDLDGGGDVTGTDSLQCLQVAVGEISDLSCDCPVIVPKEINEACLVCHAEGRTADVAAVHPGLQTLPDVNASIDAVTINVDDLAMTATVIVDFTVTAPDGGYIPGLGAPGSNATRFAYLRFAMAELVPAGEGTGDPDSWFNLTTGDRTPENLTDNGDGTYSYVFATNIYGLYDPALRERILLTISGAIVEQSKNVLYDFVPEQLPGPFVFDLSRDIVTTEACNGCHERLGSPLGSASFHGGSRYLAEGCVTCHTDTLGGEEAGGAFLLPNMVHKIHAAKVLLELPDEILDFSEVTYPQDLRNCTTCHAGTDGSNWNTRPSQVACGSCHTDVNFATGENHGIGPVPGPQPDNSQCAICHTPAGITEAHLTENATPNNPGLPEGLVTFEYVLDSVTVNENNEPVVAFHINQDGLPLDLTTIPPDGFSGGPSFLVAYALPQDGVTEMVDYNNLGRSAGQPFSVSLSSLSGTLTGTPDSYTAVLSAAPFPEGATLRAVALQGYFTQLGDDPDPEVTTDDVGRHTPSVVLAVDGDEERREVVDSNKCLNCHEILELHGGNRVNNVQVCVLCHNPNLSSSGRGTDVTTVTDAQKETLAAAGYDPNDPLTWPEATNNFKNLVHGVHGAASRAYDYEFVRNFRGASYWNWSEVTFPGILSNCETCHVSASEAYDAELPDGALVTTDVTTDGLNLTVASVNAARASVPNDTDLIQSQVAGTCYMCHDNDPAVAHMGQNGGVIDNWRAESLGE